MNKLVAIAFAAATLTTLPVATASAEAISPARDIQGATENGVKINGIKINGVRKNGIKINGVKINGVAADAATVEVLSVKLPSGQAIELAR